MNAALQDPKSPPPAKKPKLNPDLQLQRESFDRVRYVSWIHIRLNLYKLKISAAGPCVLCALSNHNQYLRLNTVRIRC